MAPIHNITGLPHFWFQKSGARGRRFDVLVVRGTFDFVPNGELLEPAATQSPIVLGDEYDGPIEENPLAAVLKRAGDLVIYKPFTDVYVSGTAHAEFDRARRSWQCGVRVGNTEKTLKLYGPRQFKRKLTGSWELTRAEPTASVLLDYRLSYGGSFTVSYGDELPPESVYKPDNPAGCGWLPGTRQLIGLSKNASKLIKEQISKLKIMDAPQIENPKLRVTNPYRNNLAAEGFSPLPRWCEPRMRYAGTYDSAWRRSSYPGFPDDFNPKFFQCAHPDLISKNYLTGSEEILLTGLLPEGTRGFSLPGWEMYAVVEREKGGASVIKLVMDTVHIDLDTQQVYMVWRAWFDRDDPVAQLGLTANYPMSDPETTVSEARKKEQANG